MQNYTGWLSKTNWSAVVLVLVTIVQSVQPFMSPQAQDVVSAILGALIIIFHLNGVKKAAVTSAALGVASGGQK